MLRNIQHTYTHEGTRIHIRIFTFSKQAFNESLDFCNMNNINLIDSFDNKLRTSNSSEVTLHGDVIDSEPHPSRTCKTSLVFAPLAVTVHTGCPALPFCTPTTPIIRLHIKTKLFCFQNYK